MNPLGQNFLQRELKSMAQIVYISIMEIVISDAWVTWERISQKQLREDEVPHPLLWEINILMAR